MLRCSVFIYSHVKQGPTDILPLVEFAALDDSFC